ncbi:hypothetical protein Bcoa_0699 [Heyndrickxia coagulans 36D1]|uniref:Uncharacterized protein n=1 Tax=Heyndrickxia coagulans 36D1 TaxID=345219 RepID=G2TQS0_HEYCO|nr:hypothetical protein Bcoa_0699 [Heyndrickxia coagulans 36D1]
MCKPLPFAGWIISRSGRYSFVLVTYLQLLHFRKIHAAEGVLQRMQPAKPAFHFFTHLPVTLNRGLPAQTDCFYIGIAERIRC